jgi:hypothetical protein
MIKNPLTAVSTHFNKDSNVGIPSFSAASVTEQHITCCNIQTSSSIVPWLRYETMWPNQDRYSQQFDNEKFCTNAMTIHLHICTTRNPFIKCAKHITNKFKTKEEEWWLKCHTCVLLVVLTMCHFKHPSVFTNYTPTKCTKFFHLLIL